MGHVSSEGGPLLLLDLDVARSWHGVSGTGDDYWTLCSTLTKRETEETASKRSGVELKVEGRPSVAWDMPTGTAELWRIAANELLLSRPWLESGDGDGAHLASGSIEITSAIGMVSIKSGWLVILWAAEDGADIDVPARVDGMRLDLSVGQSGIIAALPPALYGCEQDEVEIDGEKSVRLVIRPAL